MTRRLAEKWWLKWLILGVAIRVAVMPITVHPDLWGQAIASYFFSREGVLNFYHHVSNLPSTHPLVQNFSIAYLYIYPPLTYYTQGLLNLLIRPLLNPAFIPSLINDPSGILEFPGFLFQVFLLKLPYLFLDISAAFVLSELFTDLKKKSLAFALWMLNPLSVYATFMMGQNDILPVLFTVLSVLMYKRNNYYLSLISLGIGGSYKLYPLLFVIPAALLASGKFTKRIKYILTGFTPYILTTLPFVFSVSFRQLVMANTEKNKMFFMTWPVSGAEFIYPFLMFLVILYLKAYYKRANLSLSVIFLSVLLLIFSVTHYHPQWFLWVTPFLIWELVRSNFKHLVLVLILFLCWLFITLTFEPSLSYGLFYPLLPALSQASGLFEILAKYSDVNRLRSMVRSVFAGASLFYILVMLKVDCKR